jgi:polar amino acid transport system permease protein
VSTELHRPSDLQQERIAYRRGKAIRSVLLAAGSTAVVGVLLVVAVTGSPGWDRVKGSFFSWQIAKESFPAVVEGLWLNIRMLVVCAVLALALGLLIAVLRTLRGPVFFPVRAMATLYTYAFRGVPLIIVIYLFAFGIPGLRLQGTPNVYVLGGAALVVTYGAYLAEVFRAGIESVHPSQLAAARSLGLTYRQTMRHVVLPQAVRRVAPPLLNDTVALQKDVGLVSLAGPIDAVRAAQIATAENFNYTPYIVAAVLFVLLALPLIAVTDWVAIDKVRKVFGASVVLDDLRLAVDEHQVVALIGASGSGKSTLLRCVNLLEQIDDGAIHLDGEDITDPRVNPDEVRQRIGMVFQSYNLFPHMTVLDNITLAPTRVHRKAAGEAREQAMEWLNRVGLGDKSGSYPDRLSGGQQQRVAIVRALVNSPRLLLLDEVTSALDPELVGEVLTMIRDLKDEGMTMVLATHEMGFARQVADQVVFLDGGRVLESGPPARVLGDPTEPRTRQFLARIIEAGRL